MKPRGSHEWANHAIRHDIQSDDLVHILANLANERIVDHRLRAGSQSVIAGTSAMTTSSATRPSRNGQTARAKPPTERFPIAQVTNMAKPTGGVTRPIARLR